MAQCGCVVLPEAIQTIASEVECARHGWQAIIRKASHREVIQDILGFEIPDNDPDEPPF